MRIILVAAMAVMVMTAGCKCPMKGMCGGAKCSAKQAAVATCEKCPKGECKCKAPAAKKCMKCKGECKCKK